MIWQINAKSESYGDIYCTLLEKINEQHEIIYWSEQSRSYTHTSRLLSVIISYLFHNIMVDQLYSMKTRSSTDSRPYTWITDICWHCIAAQIAVIVSFKMVVFSSKHSTCHIEYILHNFKYMKVIMWNQAEVMGSWLCWLMFCYFCPLFVSRTIQNNKRCTMSIFTEEKKNLLCQDSLNQDVFLTIKC